MIDVKDIEHNLFDLTSVLLSPFFCSTHSFFILFSAEHRCSAFFFAHFMHTLKNSYFRAIMLLYGLIKQYVSSYLSKRFRRERKE